MSRPVGELTPFQQAIADDLGGFVQSVGELLGVIADWPGGVPEPVFSAALRISEKFSQLYERVVPGE